MEGKRGAEVAALVPWGSCCGGVGQCCGPGHWHRSVPALQLPSPPSSRACTHRPLGWLGPGEGCAQFLSNAWHPLTPWVPLGRGG